MPKINMSHLQRVLQFQTDRRRVRLAIIALLHIRVDQLCGWNRTSRLLKLNSIQGRAGHFFGHAFHMASGRC